MPDGHVDARQASAARHVQGGSDVDDGQQPGDGDRDRDVIRVPEPMAVDGDVDGRGGRATTAVPTGMPDSNGAHAVVLAGVDPHGNPAPPPGRSRSLPQEERGCAAGDFVRSSTVTAPDMRPADLTTRRRDSDTPGLLCTAAPTGSRRPTAGAVVSEDPPWAPTDGVTVLKTPPSPKDARSPPRRASTRARRAIIPGSAVPGSDWKYEALPGAATFAAIIEQGPPADVGMRRCPGASLDCWNKLAERLPAAGAGEVRAAVLAARRFLDADGFVDVVPSRTPEPRDHGPAMSTPLARPTVEDLLRKKAAAAITWEDAGCACFHRIFTLPKPDGTRRGISDLPEINAYFDAPPTFVHPAVVCAIGRGRYAVRLDLRSAFYQPHLSPRMRRYFAFALSKEEVFVYHALPMGWTWSPVIFDALLRPFDVATHVSGLVVVRYADDILVIGDSPTHVARSLLTVVELLQRAGWQLALSKAFLVAASVLDFLGVSLDLEKRASRWARDKRDKVLRCMKEIRGRGETTVRELRRLAGKLSFLLNTIPVFRCFVRPLFTTIAEHDGERVPFRLPPDVHASFDFWLSPDGNAVANRWWPFGLGEAWTARTDASDVAVGWGTIGTPDGSTLPPGTVPLPPHLAGTGSAVRETVAITYLLDYLAAECRPGPRLRAGQAITLGLDAQVVVAATNRGTAKADDLVAEFKALATCLLRLPPLALRTYWIPREQNTQADAQSRKVSLSDAMLAEHTYQHLLRWWQHRPAVDLFATLANTRAEVFYSRTPSAAAAGTDGLTAPVRPFAYAFPPFSLAAPLARLLFRYREANTPVLAILPVATWERFLRAAWPAADAWQLPDDLAWVSPPPYVDVIKPVVQLIAVCVRSASLSPLQVLTKTQTSGCH